MAKDVFELVGSSIEGKYRVDSAIGEGGFGVVYRGHHLGFDAPIAIKCLKIPTHFTPQAETLFFGRFREEGKILLKLSGEHLSILRVFDFGVATSARGVQFPYLVMEWLEGHDLQHELRERHKEGKPPFGEVEALRLLRPAIDALAVAHRAGVAHRDIKPENLFLVETDRGVVVKVLDFGIAKVMQEGETANQLDTKTSSGFRAFSPAHGAPEQFTTKRFGPSGPWTDVHALALILVEMVTLRPAFEGEELADMIDEALSERRPTPRVRGAQVSDPFEAMCTRALARAARDRYRNAQELLVAADRVLAGSPAGVVAGSPEVDTASDTLRDGPPEMAEPKSAGAVAQVIGAAPAPAGVPPAPAASPAPRSRAGVITAAVAAAIGVAGLGVWMSQRGASGEPGASGAASVAVPVEPRLTIAPGAAAEARVPRMIRVPAGTFMMGAADGSPDEKPVHAVTVAAFEMDETEVSTGDYKACVEAASCQEPDIGVDCNWGKRDRAEHPVNCVSWRDATAYCAFAKKRLPTEEEWEYAARGAAATRYPWGNAAPADLCWKRHVGEGTCRAGSFDGEKSPLGVRDLAGNVWEWTSSRFCPYSSKQCAREARVYRGGAWLSSSPEALVASNRQKDEPASRSSVVGFRCARGGG